MDVHPRFEPRAPLRQRLQRAWEVGRFAATGDREMAAAVSELIRHHVRIGFFGDRLDGMRRLTGFGADGTLEVALAPNRLKVPVTQSGSQGTCGLCDPTFPEERGLSWRNWKIWPNAFPYVPAEYEHILLTCADHVEQSFSANILGDMIDFQACAGDDRQLTLHYNGVAGNSQAHLHWQACRATLPLQTEIDRGRMRLDDIVQSTTGRVASFDQNSYCGILVEGTKGFVLRYADRIVQRLEHDPLTRGTYNMVLLEPRGERARLVIFPRRADNLHPDIGSIPRAGIGAFNVGGIIVVPRTELPADFADTIGPALRATQVPPSELPWLKELARESAVTIPHGHALLPRAA